MSTKKKTKVAHYEPVWVVGYASRTLTIAAVDANTAIQEACDRDPVLAALPLAVEPLITSDGFVCMAEIPAEEEDLL